MDRSRRAGIGQWHEYAHVACNNGRYCQGAWSITHTYMPPQLRRDGMYQVRCCPSCAVNNLFITRTARLTTLFPSFLCSTRGSKSGPYRVILDRLSGQYREIWTGPGCQ